MINEVQRIHKYMNVMKQDAMDNKMKKDAKHVKNDVCKRISIDREAVEWLSNRSQPRWIDQLSSIYRADRKFLDGSRICQESIKNAIKRSWKGSIDSLAVEKCWEAIEITQKQFFKDEKNTDVNAIKHATPPKIQNHLPTRKKKSST